MLILGVDERPGALGIKVLDGALVDDGVGDGVVGEARRGIAHSELRLVNLLGRCRIDGPVEAENIAGAVGLEALRLGRAGEDRRIGGIAREENQQRDSPIGGAKYGPVRGAAALEAGVHDIFRAVRFVGLRNEAAPAGERVLNGGRELGEGVHGEVADEVGGEVAVDDDLAGDVERHR